VTPINKTNLPSKQETGCRTPRRAFFINKLKQQQKTRTQSHDHSGISAANNNNNNNNNNNEQQCSSRRGRRHSHW
jgi:hypothetical protein